MRRILLALALLATVGCGTTVVQPTGYETGGGYMQPDHGWWYYHTLYWSTFGMYQPSVTYHVYVPPPGYPTTYRPWYRETRPTYQAPARPSVDPRRSGGLSQPSKSATPSPRTGGGFSAAQKSSQAPSSSPRTSGGFASTPAPRASSPRTSGGFSGSRKR